MEGQSSTTDPTYLRTIVDGLSSGASQKDNPSSLPQGLVGVYEEAIPPASQVTERKKFLEFFGVWALMKKEVSAEFVVSLFDGWSEEEVLAFIGRYSKWFNSPASGVYTLYHERFRTFVLQKISGSQLRDINNRLIMACNDALARRLNDEWERYALEYLSAHLLQPSLDTKERGSELKALAYNTNYWNRQIEVSKDFDWSKRLLNDMMLWASKYDEDQVIECALNKVDLHHMEQNDAPRIVELVAQNDIETALQRIESFGGNDKEGLQRKFILYMLCLMELTLLESKDKPFRKELIEMLLKHLDDNLPVDHSVLNWNDFFPSYLMFSMACEWSDLGLDYLIVYKRTEDWEANWIAEMGPYNNLQFQVLCASVQVLSDELGCRSCALIDVAAELAKHRRTRESFEVAMNINDKHYRGIALSNISCELAIQGKTEEALECVSEMGDQSNKSASLKYIASGLSKQGKLEEALACVLGINNMSDKIQALSDISSQFAKLGKINGSISVMNDAIECARSIIYKVDKVQSLANSSTELYIQGRFEAAISLMQEAQESARGMDEKSDKIRAMIYISNELDKQGKIEEAHSLFQESIGGCGFIRGEAEKGMALNYISTELAKRGKFSEAIDCAQGISSNDYSFSKALFDISNELSKHGRFTEAIACAQLIKSTEGEWGYRDYNLKIQALNQILTELNKQGVNENTIESKSCIIRELKRISSLKQISAELAKLNQFQEAANLIEESIAVCKGIGDDFKKNNTLFDIGIELFKFNKNNFGYACIQSISSELRKLLALDDLFNALLNLGKLQEASMVIIEALKCIQDLNEEEDKNSAFVRISINLAKQERFEDALKCAQSIGEKSMKCQALAFISKQLAKIGQYKEAEIILKKALECAQEIHDGSRKRKVLGDVIDELVSNEMIKQLTFAQIQFYVRGFCGEEFELGYVDNALRKISIELAKDGKIATSNACAQGISGELEKIGALADISSELARQGKLDQAASVMNEALACSRNISDEWVSDAALRDISIELCKQGNVTDAFASVIGIKDDSYKSSILKNISAELAKEGKIEEALVCAQGILDDLERGIALKDISNELVKTGMLEEAASTMQEALECADCIDDELDKYALLEDISTALVKQGKINEAIQCSLEIEEEYFKSSALSDICMELARLGNWSLAESVSLEITQIGYRQNCWNKITENICKESGFQSSFQQLKHFQHAEVKALYLKGLADTATIIEVGKEQVLMLIRCFQSHFEDMEKFLQQYALHENFFSEASEDRLERLNRTLNIQWAMDVRNKLD